MNPSTLLCRLFEEWNGHWPDSCEPLPTSGSDRRYFRLKRQGSSVIGAYNADRAENKAFISFTRHFLSLGLPVPTLLAEAPGQGIYLLSDLGDETLFSRLSGCRTGEEFPDELLLLYRQAVAQLPQFQIVGGRQLDFSVCYPRAAFDKRSMHWDLNYFKYYFLKLARFPFDEQKLEDDFVRLADMLSEADSHYFLYRDFQSRNIMIHDESLWFIDYQGGRRGALPYDLASLLYDAKANLPEDIRLLLLEDYLKALGELTRIDSQQFRHEFYRFVLIRILQALGAYGFRGFYEQKNHFLLSIPYAVKNLQHLLQNHLLPTGLPELTRILENIITNPAMMEYGQTTSRLTVSIWSFSYKKGIPTDTSGNGGGFVFDCRGLPNPGRLDNLKEFTGLDEPVSEYLKQQKEVTTFAEKSQSLVGQTIENYLMRGFNHLMVSFGCTGGKHRSVYLANQMAAFIRRKYDVNMTVRHREQESL